MSTNQNITQTSIVKPPSYVEGPAKAFSQRITSLLDPSKIEVDPSKFQEQVAGLSPLQQQAAQMAATQAGLGTLTFDPAGAVSGVGQGTGIAGFQPFLSAAAGMTGPQAAQAFMSPFQQQVIDATRQSFERDRAAGRQAISDAAIQAGAFGGGREGVQRAVYDAETAARLAELEAGLRQEGLQTARDEAARQFDMQTGLARLQPELAEGLQSALSGFGTTSQVQQQQVLDAEQLNRQRQEEAFRNQLIDFANLFTTLQGGQAQQRQEFQPAPTRLQGILGAGTMLGSVLGGLGSILGQ
jgi:hypothetical protein